MRPILAILLALLWVPATTHCRLEMIPGLEFLHCFADTPADSDCEGDSCQSVESASYKPEDTQPVLQVPAIVFDLLRASLSVEPTSAPRTTEQTGAPPELPASWQFSRRAALPLRAPPLVS